MKSKIYAMTNTNSLGMVKLHYIYSTKLPSFLSMTEDEANERNQNLSFETSGMKWKEVKIQVEILK